jgi:hypothetical protein
MALNTKHALHNSQWIFEFSVAIAIMKFARLVLLFSLLLKVTDRQGTDEDQDIRTPQLR